MHVYRGERSNIAHRINTKDQSGRIYNSYSTGDQELTAAILNEPSSSLGYTLKLGLFNAINPCHCVITIT